MKALFKRSSPPPSTSPGTPFPTLEASKEARTSSSLSPSFIRNRGFSITRDHSSPSPTKVISSPIPQIQPVDYSDSFVKTRRRLQSGGVAFDEVLPHHHLMHPTTPLPSPPLHTATCMTSSPLAAARPRPAPSMLPISPGVPPSPTRAAAPVPPVSEIRKMETEGEDLASVQSLAALPPPPTPILARTTRPSVRRRGDVPEVGIHTSSIDAVVSRNIPTPREYPAGLVRPTLAFRRASSMDDVNAMIASEHPGGRRARKASTTPPSPTRPMAHSRVISDRSRNSASVQLLSPLSIPARPRAISTSVVGKHTAAPRRPPFARSVEMHSVRYSARLANGSSNAPNAVEKALGPSALSSSKVRAVGTPPALNTSDVFYPASPGPHTPTSMFSVYPEYERDMGCKVPFPSDSNAPRTVLHPPENPQMETAIQIDATRVPLGKYDITQDLTFVLRIQNIVANDVEVVLVKTEESKETVYELKIKKKDPDNMRVRGGIIPYSYVPPFASSASSSSGSSSMCSSPVTTPPLEFPPRHHYGSYFPTAYSNGFLYKTPSRGAMVTKPARNARLSNASTRTPLARSRQSTTTNVTVRDVSGSAPPAIITSNKGQVGLTNAGPPPSPMYGRRVPSAAFNRYESDGDDDEDDNASVLAHYAYRDACPIPAMSPTGSIGRGMKHSENPFFGKSAFTSEDDDYVQEQEGEGIDSSAARPAIKSHWSDTETEQETENEDEGEEAELSSPGCSSLLL